MTRMTGPNCAIMCTHTHTHNESSSGDGDENKDGDVLGNEDGIGEGGREAKKCKNPHRSCRRHVINGRDLGGKGSKRRHEGIGSIISNPDNIEKRKEAGGRSTRYPGRI